MDRLGLLQGLLLAIVDKRGPAEFKVISVYLVSSWSTLFQCCCKKNTHKVSIIRFLPKLGDLGMCQLVFKILCFECYDPFSFPQDDFNYYMDSFRTTPIFYWQLLLYFTKQFLNQNSFAFFFFFHFRLRHQLFGQPQMFPSQSHYG